MRPQIGVVGIVDSIVNRLGIFVKNRITSYGQKPAFRDQTTADGLFKKGFRKIRTEGPKGFILSRGIRYGHVQLLEHAGRWVYVSIEDYWGKQAKVGANVLSDAVGESSYLTCEHIG